MFDRMPDWDILTTVDADIFRQSTPPDHGNYVLPAKPPNADAVTQMHPDCHLHYGPGECSSDFFLNLSENNLHSPTIASHTASACAFPSVAPRVRTDFSVDNYGKLDCPSERGKTNPPLSSSVDLHVGSPYRKSVEIYETVDQIESRKRKKTSQVHKSSERRRRDRINEKMKTLQNLLPNCNKSDKASILGDAIEYLKILQHYVQMMTMGVCRGSFHSPPMQCMELGMGYGVGMVGMALPLISVQGNPLHHSSLSAASSLMSIPGIGAPQPFQIPVPMPRFFPLSTTPAPITSPSNTNGVAISKKCRK